MNRGKHKSPQFLKLNPMGQVPVLIDGEVVIRDSHAILVYLARCYGGEDWLPVKAEPMGKVMQWLSTAANEIQHSFAAARRYYRLNAGLDIELAQHKAHQILRILNQHMEALNWLECSHPTIADIACFPYIGLAPDGKIFLDPYPHVVNWIERIRQLPGYIGMIGLYEFKVQQNLKNDR
jgi:glutathione S-transferase